MKRIIPNFLTSMNVLSGCIATVMAMHGEYCWVLFWVIIAALFDFLDGFSARMLKVKTTIGKDLDSLADILSFGLVPGITVFMLLSSKVIIISSNPIICTYLPYFAFLLTIFSALRLAKFNVDTRQTESFIGLNTPANALFWVSFCAGLTSSTHIAIDAGIVYTILFGIIAFSALLVSEIPMFSLKVKSFKFRGNQQRYIMLLLTILLITFWQMLGIAASILLYIALSIFYPNPSSAKTKE